MKEIIGLIMIVCGVVFGLYAGIWWAFIGGIMNVIEAIRAPNLVAMDVAIGVAKVVFATLIGWFSGVVIAIPGYVLLKS